jgi:hypothetical protein
MWQGQGRIADQGPIGVLSPYTALSYAGLAATADFVLEVSAGGGNEDCGAPQPASIEASNVVASSGFFVVCIPLRVAIRRPQVYPKVVSRAIDAMAPPIDGTPSPD